MTEREIAILKNRVMPQIRKIEFSDGSCYRIENGCDVQIKVSGKIADQSVAFAKEMILQYWQADASVTTAELEKKMQQEAYAVSIGAKKLTISAQTLKGLRYAFCTLRQLAEPERNVEFYTHHILPRCKIQDSPAIPFRGLHLCWFPETPYFEMEKQVRLAAYFKYNYVVIEPWGIYPYKSHPELCFQDMKIKRKDLKKLVDVAISLGLTPIPQINLFGHGSWARSCVGKHATLGAHPELASLFEPDGWTWCLTNPVVRKYQTDLMDEMLEVFHHPPFFHAGCDEADNMLTCSTCRKEDPAVLIAGHLKFIHDHLAEHGVRMLMWHDMLIEQHDPRWPDYIANGKAIDGTASLLKKLPKDIVICDWQYGYPAKDGKEPEWSTTAHFKRHGFDVLVSPWLDSAGMQSLIKFAANKKLMGVLQTTWHYNRGCHLPLFYVCAANTAWNPEQNNGNHANFNRMLRQVDEDAGFSSSYRKSARASWQVDPES